MDEPVGAAATDGWRELDESRPRWSEAVPNLWFGGTQTGRATVGPDLDEFDLVITLDAATAQQEPAGDQELVYPFPDGSIPDILPEIVWKVMDGHACGWTVLVRCAEGINRSALVVAMAMQHMFGMSREETIEVLRAARHPHVLARTAYQQLLPTDPSEEPTS